MGDRSLYALVHISVLGLSTDRSIYHGQKQEIFLVLLKRRNGSPFLRCLSPLLELRSPVCILSNSSDIQVAKKRGQDQGYSCSPPVVGTDMVPLPHPVRCLSTFLLTDHHSSPLKMVIKFFISTLEFFDSKHG